MLFSRQLLGGAHLSPSSSLVSTPALQMHCRVPSLLGFKHVGVEVRLVADGKIAVKRGTFGAPQPALHIAEATLVPPELMEPHGLPVCQLPPADVCTLSLAARSTSLQCVFDCLLSLNALSSR